MTQEQKFYKALQDIFICSKIEGEATPNPTIDTVQKIAKALGVPVAELFK